MRLPISVPPAAAVLLLLAACDGEKPKTDDQRTAVGQILPGSVSDEMIRAETLRSQPPLAPEAAISGAAGASKRDPSPNGKPRASVGNDSANTQTPPAADAPKSQAEVPEPSSE